MTSIRSGQRWRHSLTAKRRKMRERSVQRYGARRSGYHGKEKGTYSLALSGLSGIIAVEDNLT